MWLRPYKISTSSFLVPLFHSRHFIPNIWPRDSPSYSHSFFGNNIKRRSQSNPFNHISNNIDCWPMIWVRKRWPRMSYLKMITLLFIIAGTIVAVKATTEKKIWAKATLWASTIVILTIIVLPPNSSATETVWGMAKDRIRTPLVYLSAWLIPVSILARKGHLSKSSLKTQKAFITLIFIILFFLYITFLSKRFIALFLGFEGTLLPTLFLITRWGAQQERVEAGVFFVFYTLISSLPLFIGLLYLYKTAHKLSITHLNLESTGTIQTIVALCCMVAFLVKVPIFSVHLWLPKAHVEAPVAGSMILAAILLKMGGYGFIRLSTLFFQPFKDHIKDVLIPFCIWGGLLTRLICLTQTDLKSLIAYSSVSHMRFMIAGIRTLSQWALMGGLIVMVAHGIVSSALFCIANTFYERSSTRTLMVNRRTKLIFALTPSLWLIFACAKMGLPPIPKAIGETVIISSIISKKIVKYLPTLAGVVATGIFRLFMFLALKTGRHQAWRRIKNNMKEREQGTLAAHLIPLLLLILTPNLITPWLT